MSDPAQPDEAALRLAEALLFAAAEPVSARVLAQILPAGEEPEAVLAELARRYAGRGIELATVAGGVQFRTAPDLAPRLKTVVHQPRRLPRVAMETLAIIAYHQPVTRPEIEAIRGATLSQDTLDQLLEAHLVTPQGRKEAPGRPTLWVTTPQFLAAFGLSALADLPRREDLLSEPVSGPRSALPQVAHEGDQPATENKASGPRSALPQTVNEGDKPATENKE